MYDPVTGVCANCGLDPYEFRGYKDYLEFEVKKIQKMGNRFIIHIPTSLHHSLKEMGRDQKFVIKAYPLSSIRYKKVRMD